MAGSKTILFVEDDKPISAMYARVLKKNGYEVDFAYDGNAGLQMALARVYDLILLDIMMPGQTGIEVLKSLRGGDGKGAAETKIIVLTNLAWDKTSEDALGAKADGYLVKADIVPSELVTIIGQIL